MDTDRFDSLTRSFAVSDSRRGILKLAGAGIAALGFGSVLADDGEAATCVKPGRRCTKPNGKKKKCCKGAKCQGTTCECRGNKTQCRKQCVNLKNDSKNCGNCGAKCSSGSSCKSGSCENGSCGTGEEPCGNTCCDPGETCTDPDTGTCETVDSAVCPVGEDTCVEGVQTCDNTENCRCYTAFDGSTVCARTGVVCDVGCTSHADCVTLIGAGAICFRVTGSNCLCDLGDTNSCAFPCVPLD